MIHKRNWVYRNVKPDHFLLGRPGSAAANSIHIVDLGKCRKHGSRSGNAREGSLSGLAPFMSINSHRGCSPSYGDDLEAFAYVFFYWLTGSLPWWGMRTWEEIRKAKETTMIEVLCKDHPGEFGEYLEYSRQLGTSRAPDYRHIQSIFTRILQRTGGPGNNQFDWTNQRKDLNMPAASEKREVLVAATSFLASGSPTFDFLTPPDRDSVLRVMTDMAPKWLVWLRSLKGQQVPPVTHVYYDDSTQRGFGELSKFVAASCSMMGKLRRDAAVQQRAAEDGDGEGTEDEGYSTSGSGATKTPESSVLERHLGELAKTVERTAYQFLQAGGDEKGVGCLLQLLQTTVEIAGLV